jgi:hypothetical protein
LIDLVKKAQEESRRREDRAPTEWAGPPIVSPDSLKRGLARLSDERVQDTLLAEAGDFAKWIERFRSGKAEHNEQTLVALLGLERKQALEVIGVLMELGFLEKVGATYKIPILYRDGLNITQGKAFAASGSDGGDTDED